MKRPITDGKWTAPLQVRQEPRYRDEEVEIAPSIQGRHGSNNWKPESKRLITLIRIFNGRCFYCSIPYEPDKFSADHLVPKSRGGPDALHNRVLACKACDTQKGNRWPTQEECLRAERIRRESGVLAVLPPMTQKREGGK